MRSTLLLNVQMWKEWLIWLWVCFHTELKQTVLNSWYVKAMGVRRGIKTGAKQGGAIEGIALHKTYELTLYTMIVYNSENSIRSTRLFFIHCFVTEVLWSRLYFIPLKVVNPSWDLTNNYYWNLTSLAESAPGSERPFAPLWKLGVRTKSF